MKPRTRESVTYTAVVLQNPADLMCYNGPHDGERRMIHPQSCMGDIVAVWDLAGERCEVYQTVLRFSTRGPSPRIVLRWVP